MFIIRKKNEPDICFIHMYKCAGMSILKSLNDEKLIDNRYSFIHNSLYNYPYRKYSKNISLIRNPLTWYESLVNYEMSRIDNNLGINLFARYFIFKDYPNNDKRMDFNMSINRMINMFDFFKEQPHQLEHFKNELLPNKYSNRMVMNIFNIKKIEDITNMKLEKTYYQEMCKRFGIYDTTTYRMEDELDKIIKILGIKNLVHININKKYNKINKKQISIIKKNDINLFLKFGYKI